MSNKILIVDDEPDILEFLRYNLEKDGHVVQSASNGIDALDRINSFSPQLIVLDIMMPKMNGIDTCIKLRENKKNKNMIVVFLSAISEEFSQIACYDAGGDDFVSKPIQPRLLIKKINVLLKRSLYSSHDLEFNGIRIDKDKYVVYCDGKPISFPKKEFELLDLLYSKPGKVFLREEIISAVWGTDYFISSRNIDVQIRKIRSKIGVNKIDTIKGVGYRFNES